VHGFGGRVEELTATSLVAVFGLEPTEGAPRHAALAALAIQRDAQRTREMGETASEVMIALHAATFAIGRAGSRIEIDAAARRVQWGVLDQLLRTTGPSETVASAAAAIFLERRFELVPASETTEEPSQAYRLTGQERRGLGLWGGMTPFVGRSQELALLRHHLDLAVAGNGQAVAIVGEAGVGKSRLIYELASAQRLGDWRVLETGGISYGQAMSYLPVVALLRDYFAVRDGDDGQAVRDKVAKALLMLDADLEPTLPALLALLTCPSTMPTGGP